MRRRKKENKYGKTAGVYTPKSTRVKKGNKVSLTNDESVTVGGRPGRIRDRREIQGIFFYFIEWNEARLTYYDRLIGQEPSKFGWSQSRFIRRADA